MAVVARQRARGSALAVVLLLLGSAIDASAARRACVREGCRPPGADCARAFRDRLHAALDACGAAKSPATKACRQAARRAARNGIAACRASVRACAACCRDSGAACDVAVCGNGLVEPGESCDGAATSTCPRGCRADCACVPEPAPVCGNGLKEGGEQCDGTDAVACPGRCLASCTCAPEPPRCGDGVVNQESEQCDGAAIGPCEAACDATCACLPPVCGNGIRAGDEQCDGADDDACPGRCVDDCSCGPEPPRCGDGIVNGDDDCDGEAASGCEVACDDACRCVPPVCGNGIWFGDEECDGGDGYCPADQCRADCTCEPPVCGDGRREYREPCEPGVDDGICFPGCLPDCTCAVCGNGVIDAPVATCEPTDASACADVCSPQTCACVSSTTDSCEAARELGSLPASDRQTTAGATTVPSDPPFFCSGGQVPHGGTVWYTFVAPASGRVTADTAGSFYDTVLGAYTGACGALTSVACNDDNALGNAARIDFPVVGGTRYLLQAAPYGGRYGGDLLLAVEFRSCGDAAVDPGEECEPNLPESCTTGTCSPKCECLDLPVDECVDAPVATELPIQARVSAYTTTGNAADPTLECGSTAVHPPSAWFRFVAPTDGIVDVSTANSDFDTVLGVLTGDCGALTVEACDDDGGLGYTSVIAQPVTAGTTYTVLVTPYYQDALGRLDLSIAYEAQ